MYEIRIEYERNIYRIFSFYDAGNLIVLGNAFKKKTQKTPKSQIKLALNHFIELLTLKKIIEAGLGKKLKMQIS